MIGPHGAAPETRHVFNQAFAAAHRPQATERAMLVTANRLVDGLGLPIVPRLRGLELRGEVK
jgi:hypothetical protein